MTQPQTEPLTPYAPLPVRARGTLEIFDTAFKLFRRYAGVLLAWSALSSIVNLIPFFGELIYIFTMPLMFGAVSCVVAGAVRGQDVGFKQIWGFTKPRYGALLGVLILALILMGLVGIGLLIGVSLGVALIAAAAIKFGWFAMGVTWIVAALVGLTGSSFLLALLMGWFNLAPVVACLEDNNRGSNALSRAWSLLAGNWRKACGVATILALAGTAVLVILGGFAFLFFGGGWEKFIGFDISSVSMLATLAFITLFFFGWTPLQAVVGAVFYLDLRTRKEALDLEWTNYAAKPEMLPGQEPSVSQQPAFSPAPAPSAPTVGQPTAPAPTLPGMPSSPAEPSFASAPPAAPTPPPTMPSQTAPTVFAAQSPAQEVAPEVVPAVVPAPVTLAPHSPAFASLAEMSPTNGDAASAPIATPVETAPPSGIVAPASVASTSPAFSELEAAFQSQTPLEPVPTVPSAEVAAPSAASVPTPPAPAPAPSPVAVTPTPASPPPAPIPPAPAAMPEPEATSSFAPRRFRRAASEDDDYPSSFGGGAR